MCALAGRPGSGEAPACNQVVCAASPHVLRCTSSKGIPGNDDGCCGCAGAWWHDGDRCRHPCCMHQQLQLQAQVMACYPVVPLPKGQGKQQRPACSKHVDRLVWQGRSMRCRRFAASDDVHITTWCTWLRYMLLLLVLADSYSECTAGAQHVAHQVL